MRPEPSIREKIAEIFDEAELTGFLGQLQADGNATLENINLIEVQRQKIRTGKGWQ